MRCALATHRAAWAVVAAACLLAAGGCEPPPDVEPQVCGAGPPPQAQLGLGDEDTGFVPLRRGDDAPIVLGPQGLHMIVLALRVAPWDPRASAEGATKLKVAIEHEGEVVGGVVDRLAPSKVEGDRADFLGIRAVFTVAEVLPLGGETALIEASVEDACGHAISAKEEVRLTIP